MQRGESIIVDHEFVFKIKHGKQKFILREAFKNIIPADIYNRHHKIGFYNPHARKVQSSESP